MKKAKPNFIYIGPTIPPLGLKKNTLYRSEDLPLALSRIAESARAVRSLYIRTADLAEAKKRQTEKGTLEHTANAVMLELAQHTPR